MPPPPANCPSCGARVDAVQGDAAFVYSCHFCKANIPIDPLVVRPVPRVVVAQVTPFDARAAAGVRAARSSAVMVTVLALVPAIIGVGIALRPVLSPLFASTFGNFPIDIPLNGEGEISNRTATGTDTMVTVGVNGKVTLRGCKLTGPLIVKAGTNAEVTIIDSTLSGAKGIIEGDANLKVTIQNSKITSGEEIVDAPVNAKVDVSKGSVLTAAGVAFPMEGNAEIAIDGSSVEGKLGGIAFKNNGHVKMTGDAVVKSDGVAIELDQNGHVAITGGRVEGKVIALKVGDNAEGTLRSTSLVGKEALSVGSYGKLVVAATAIVGTKKVGAGSKIEER